MLETILVSSNKAVIQEITAYNLYKVSCKNPSW